MTLEPKELLVQIHENFSRVQYPGDDHIVLDNTGGHLECEDIKQALRGRHWREIPFEELDELRSALFFLSPQGYRFYLPAFMFYSVTDFYRADVIPYEVIQTLTIPQESDLQWIKELARLHPGMPPYDRGEWERTLRMIAEKHAIGSIERLFFERVSALDTGQCEVIHKFLKYMHNVYGDHFPNRQPQIAIERYWFQF